MAQPQLVEEDVDVRVVGVEEAHPDVAVRGVERVVASQFVGRREGADPRAVSRRSGEVDVAELTGIGAAAGGRAQFRDRRTAEEGESHPGGASVRHEFARAVESGHSGGISL
jgi:hypothetical protein